MSQSTKDFVDVLFKFAVIAGIVAFLFFYATGRSVGRYLYIANGELEYVMILLVRARRLEIGIRRAVGARRSDIIHQFLIESGMPFFFPGSGNGGEHDGGTQSWNAGNSFLFDGGQELVKGSNLGISPIGNWGFGASLNNISFIEKLTNRLTFAYVHGNNSSNAIRYANSVLGSNPIFVMGFSGACRAHRSLPVEGLVVRARI